MRLVERDLLLEALRAEQAQASDGHGRVVLITGEAGSGKSAFARAALPAAVWGYCEPLTTPRPLGPFRDIGAVLWPSPPSRSNALSVADRLLEHMRRPGPAVVVEDAHWIDSASGEVIRFLGRRIAATHGLLVIISRDNPAVPSALPTVVGELVATESLTRIEVPTLTVAAVAELTHGTGIDLAEAMRLTGGNALLVTQLTASGTEQPPADLQAAIAARLGRLRPRPHQLAVSLSVVPGRIPGAALSDDEWNDVVSLSRPNSSTSSTVMSSSDTNSSAWQSKQHLRPGADVRCTRTP